LAGLLRKCARSDWRAKREIQTYVKERDAIVAFFSGRLRAIREGSVEPVTDFSQAYAVLDELWNFARLNRRIPHPERIAKFVSFISRQDYIAKHGWHHRDWVGDKTNGLRRKEAQNDSNRMEDHQVVQAEGIRRPDEPGVGQADEVGDSRETGSDPLFDWDAPGGNERV